MVDTVDNAAHRRAYAEMAHAQREAQSRAKGQAVDTENKVEPIPEILKRPSGLGVQIDAMIQRLKDDGHSPENIARVMRLRADKMEAAE